MTGRCLLVVADYPYLEVGECVFAEIPWDAALARLYQPAFDKVLLLGRVRRAPSPPAGWMPVDRSRFEVIDAGDWRSPVQFLRNFPRLLGALSRVWPRVAVVYLKLFYLNSVAVWCYNRLRGAGARRPVATLLVGDAADAILLREDLFRYVWARQAASRGVAAIIRHIQRRVDVAGFWARFLEVKFAAPASRNLVVNEPWLHESQIHVHDRGGPRRPATILFVGRLVQRKRARLVLEAMALLACDGVPLRGVVVGDGPERPSLQARARDLGLAEAVRFTGWLGVLCAEMLTAYDEADILCLPSFAEGLPLVVIEAMGRGAAVVATAVSGTPEAVEHERSGLLVPRDDANALAAAIRRLIDDPVLWRRCVDAGYEVARRHTFEAQRERLAQAITGLAA